MFMLVADNKLKVEARKVSLDDIEKLWDIEVLDGKRLVVKISGYHLKKMCFNSIYWKLPVEKLIIRSSG